MNIRPDPNLFFDPSKCFIGGRWVAPLGGDYLPVENPSDGALIAQIPRGTSADIDAAVTASQTALSGAWGKTPAAERGRILARIGRLVLERVDDLARIEALDVGKPLKQARADAIALARYMEFYGGAADKVMGETIPYLDGYTVYTLREPHGVTGHIIPWNYPMQVLGRSVGGALTMGNAVVLKPAEEACLTAIAFAQIAQEAGLPDGALNVVPGLGEEAGAALTSHPGVNHISFTGSVPVGQIIQRAAAQNVVPVTLELGGKSPQLVFADAGLDRALRVGPAIADLDLGPMVSERQKDVVDGFLGNLGGAEIAARGTVESDAPKAGHYLQPTLLTGVAPDNRLAQDEIFGPVQVVIPFDSEEAAEAIANGTDFGLVAGIWTADGGRQMRLAKAIRSGQVFINNYGAGGGVALPFGGTGKSGFGREKGMEALYGFSVLKTVAAWHG